MSIKALFGSKQPKTVPPPPVEETVSDISKDLDTTIAKLEARTKALDVKISLAEAAAAAANEAKRQAVAEQTDAFDLSKKVKDIVAPRGPAPALKVVSVVPGNNGDRPRANGGA